MRKTNQIPQSIFPVKYNIDGSNSEHEQSDQFLVFKRNYFAAILTNPGEPDYPGSVFFQKPRLNVENKAKILNQIFFESIINNSVF